MKPLAIAALFCAAQATADTLPALDLDLDLESITVSGLSSGGFMATQFQLAHAQWVSGAGLIASGPYFCAQGSINTALSQCVNKVDTAIPLDTLLSSANTFEQQGTLGPLSAVAGHKVWMLHGTKDTRVVEAVSDALYQQYQDLGVKALVYVNDQPFAHHFPSETNGVACDTSAAPFVGQCNYDAAGAMLKHLDMATKSKSQAKAAHLHRFSQQALGGEAARGLAEQGFVYIPEACAEGKPCRVHVNFHGCNQQADAVGTDYITQNGINDWAESNQMVVLYPQTKASMFMPLNPQAGWDWWGYTDEHYATRKGQQIRAVESMVRALDSTVQK